MDEELASGPAIAETNVEAPVEATKTEAESAPATPEAREPERDKIQERFDKLTRDKYEALRAADTARYEAESLKERLKALETAKTEPVAPTHEPTLEEFGFDDAKYRAALKEYLIAEAKREVRSTFQQEREAIQRAEREAAFQKRQQEFIASKPDYAEKVLRNPALPITNDMAQAIRESDLGPQVAYYLAENVEKAVLISQMSPSAQLRELGRIEARLEASKAPVPPPVSKAPPPPPSIAAVDSSRKVSTTSPESDSLSDQEWVAAERKRTSRKRA